MANSEPGRSRKPGIPTRETRFRKPDLPAASRNSGIAAHPAPEVAPNAMIRLSSSAANVRRGRPLGSESRYQEAMFADTLSDSGVTQGGNNVQPRMPGA